MLYCPDCMHLSDPDTDICSNCGSRRLRAPKDNDPVYLLTESTEFVHTLQWLMEQDKIPYMEKNAELTTKPYVMNVRRLDIFVPYSFYGQSLQLAKDLSPQNSLKTKALSLRKTAGKSNPI